MMQNGFQAMPFFLGNVWWLCVGVPSCCVFHLQFLLGSTVYLWIWKVQWFGAGVFFGTKFWIEKRQELVGSDQPQRLVDRQLNALKNRALERKKWSWKGTSDWRIHLTKIRTSHLPGKLIYIKLLCIYIYIMWCAWTRCLLFPIYTHNINIHIHKYIYCIYLEYSTGWPSVKCPYFISDVFFSAWSEGYRKSEVSEVLVIHRSSDGLSSTLPNKWWGLLNIKHTSISYSRFVRMGYSLRC